MAVIRLERQLRVWVGNDGAIATDQKGKAVGRGLDGRNGGNHAVEHDITRRDRLHLRGGAHQIRKRDDELARAGTNKGLGDRRPSRLQRPLVPSTLGGIVVRSAFAVF